MNKNKRISRREKKRLKIKLLQIEKHGMDQTLILTMHVYVAPSNAQNARLIAKLR